MNRIIPVFVLVIFFTAALSAEESQPIPVDGKRAAEIFEQFKKQAGLWRGKSTAGWENRLNVEVIAKGSAVLETSHFVDTGTGMATTVYMHGDRLMLTHYCEAGNQPTLAATSEGPNGEITFEFVSGTGMPDRNTGHMDKVIFRFIDDNHYRSQWTWYSKGKETWMEDIEYERLR